MARILVVDDEPKVRRLLTDHLTAEGHRVATCETFEEAAGALERDAVELLITDVRLPGRSGLDLLRHARRLQPELPCVVITAYGSVSDAVRAVKLGAADYLEKPFALDALTVVVSKTLEAASIRAEHEYLIREAGEGEPRAVLVGSSPAMREVHELIGKVGRTRSGVLVVGESGTG